DAADPLDEFLAAALAYERTHPPSLQGFLHWLDVGEAEIKRELAGLTRDEVRIMTVHGSKGLEAPVVFLPDTVQESEKLPNVLWTEDSLPLWLAHRGCGAPLSDRATALAIERRDQEYRRLLYVALTRAEDRLYVCGWRNQQKMSATCWYALVQEGLSREGRARKFAFDMPLLPEDERWRGEGWRLTNPQEGKAKPDHHAPARDQGGGELPPWARARPLPEPTPPKPLAPSKPRHADPPARSPLGSDGGEGFRRGRLIHRLLQFLPERPAAERPDLARRFLAQSLHELSPGQQREILGETLAVLDHPEFAPLFGAGSRAEVPVVGLLGGRVLSGQIDRLVVGEGSVLILDYKTLRPPPLDEEGIPEAYLEQLAAYHAAVRSIYPGHEVRAALLWTDGPRLMPVAPHRLARYTL
ncbi:MAG TPA: 3'-5' exonuclease, partial [Stellaceae bacterium]|nr:3'-5' exonuclease [Stellaceae bacterium]